MIFLQILMIYFRNRQVWKFINYVCNFLIYGYWKFCEILSKILKQMYIVIEYLLFRFYYWILLWYNLLAFAITCNKWIEANVCFPYTRTSRYLAIKIKVIILYEETCQRTAYIYIF